MMEPTMETWLSIGSAVVSGLMAVVAGLLSRSVKAADKDMEENKKKVGELEIRLRTVETETIQGLRADLDMKLDGIKETLSTMAADLAVLKDRDHNTRVNDRRKRT